MANEAAKSGMIRLTLASETRPLPALVATLTFLVLSVAALIPARHVDLPAPRGG